MLLREMRKKSLIGLSGMKSSKTGPHARKGKSSTAPQDGGGANGRAARETAQASDGPARVRGRRPQAYT